MFGLQPDLWRPPPPSLLPDGAAPYEFEKAAAEALSKAGTLAKSNKLKPIIMGMVPETVSHYNIYLNKGMEFEGFTAAINGTHNAMMRRKQAFMQSSKIQWAISFNRQTGDVVVHHRSGYRARFMKE